MSFVVSCLHLLALVLSRQRIKLSRQQIKAQQLNFCYVQSIIRELSKVYAQ